MLRVVICCGAGMSSSYLTQKLQNMTKEKGLENEVSFDFFAIDMARVTAEEVLKNYDVALCCPHLKNFVNNLCKTTPLTCAMHIFPPRMYGTLPYDEVLQEAKDVLAKFKEDGINPVVFPGEDNPLSVKRLVAWSNQNK